MLALLPLLLLTAQAMLLGAVVLDALLAPRFGTSLSLVLTTVAALIVPICAGRPWRKGGLARGLWITLGFNLLGLLVCFNLPGEILQRSLVKRGTSPTRVLARLFAKPVQPAGPAVIKPIDRTPVKVDAGTPRDISQPVAQKSADIGIDRGPVVSPSVAAGKYRVAFKKRDSSLIVPVQIRGKNGLVFAQMILDTGATLSTLNGATLNKLGVKLDRRLPRVPVQTAGGRGVRALALIDGVAVGKAEVRQPMAVSVCETCAMGDTVGLLGLNFARHFRVTVDQQAGEVLFEPRATSALANPDTQHFVDFKNVRAMTFGDADGLTFKVELDVVSYSPLELRNVEIAAVLEGSTAGTKGRTISGHLRYLPAFGSRPLKIVTTVLQKVKRYRLEFRKGAWATNP